MKLKMRMKGAVNGAAWSHSYSQLHEDSSKVESNEGSTNRPDIEAHGTPQVLEAFPSSDCLTFQSLSLAVVH